MRCRAILLLSLIVVCQFSSTVFAEQLPQVELKTSMDSIELGLYQNKAPRTVKNFLNYVNSGFYNNMIFHRIVAD